jgi:hypothetical protein
MLTRNSSFKIANNTTEFSLFLKIFAPLRLCVKLSFVQESQA